MRYRIVVRPKAQRDLESLPRQEQGRIAKRIDALAMEPRPPGARKLKGAEDLYRLRSGNYRVIYMIEDRVITITVIRIGHRRDIYR